MKLNYFDLISPAPVQIQNAGGIISPTLRDIYRIGYEVYQRYLSIALMDVKTYLFTIGQEKLFEQLSFQERQQINLFELLTANEQTRSLLLNALNFFFKETIASSPDGQSFIVQNNNKDIGVITKDSYAYIFDVICQRNCVKSKQDNISKVKNKKAQEIMKKISLMKSKRAKQAAADPNMELGNIISAVANKSLSLNILNIWDLTVYQLWDCFSRLTNNNIYAIQSMSVAAWGNKDNYFDAASWFKRIDTIS